MPYLVSVTTTTDGAKSMIGFKSGLIGRINSKMSELNLSPPMEFTALFTNKHYVGKF
jgi:hypothetical protein